MKTASSIGGCSTPGRIHRGLQKFVEDLNRLYLAAPGLWQADYDHGGFYWIDCTDRDNSVLSFVRQTADGSNQLAVILNLTPVPRPNISHRPAARRQMARSLEQRRGDLRRQQPGKFRRRHGGKYPCHNQPCSAEFCLPPLSVLVFQPEV